MFYRSRRCENPHYIQFGHLRFEWGIDYTAGYEREAVYRPEQSEKKDFVTDERTKARTEKEMV